MRRLPDGLDALAPRFIDQIPTDVIGGQPLRYHRTSDDGYVVYSIGWNRSDDGGAIGTNRSDDGGEVAWKKQKKLSADITHGDWIWQQPAR